VSYLEQIFRQRAEKNAYFKTSKDSPLTHQDKLSFTNLNYYPPNERFKFIVEIKPFSASDEVGLRTSKGTIKYFTRQGYIEFEIQNNKFILTIFKSTDSKYLFLPFKDLTSKNDTYPAGRYIELEKVDQDTYILDFNKAYNPYCAYSEKFNCPLVPFENQLSVEIEAGEKRYINMNK